MKKRKFRIDTRGICEHDYHDVEFYEIPKDRLKEIEDSIN